MSATTSSAAATGTGGTGGAAEARAVYLVKGDDPSLVAQEAHRLVETLVDGGDPTLMVEEFGGPSADDLDIGALIDACTTPPFLVERRVVVLRDAGQLLAADAKRLVTYLDDPLPTTALVLMGGGGTIPPTLTKRVGAVGEVVDTAVGRGRARDQWLDTHLKDAPVRLDGRAAARLADHLGTDMGRLSGLLASLASAYGQGAAVSLDDLEPFLGEAGAVLPWDLTDALDAGDTAKALGVLHRMLGASGSHPLVVMATLHRHFRAMLRLDGSGITSQEEAAAALGLSSPFMAKKALAQSRRLGTPGIARAVQLLAEADIDLRGATMLSGDLVLEVLVARLARLVRRPRG
jgi:DNA polymerase-3 subunit delta